MAQPVKKDIIIVASHEEAARQQISAKLIMAGLRCLTASSSAETIELIYHRDVALVLLEAAMPGRSGLQVLQEITAVSPDTAVVTMLDGRDREAAVRCLDLGAADYLVKPANLEETLLKTRRILDWRQLVMQHREYKTTLEQRVSERTRDLIQTVAKMKSAAVDTLVRLARAAEYKDEDTGSHIQRMSRYTALVAERMGLADDYVESLLYAATMHDIGKIGIPDSILLKPGKLTDEEWSVMKQHTVIGARILDGAEAEIVKLGAAIAISHHEKWNGSGYPFGFKGEEIPLPGRIAAIADVFDSLTSKRAYRKDDFTADETFKIIEQSVGVQFDPAVFAAFKAAWPDIRAEHQRFRTLEASRASSQIDTAVLS
ncbi:HD domain-containing phosphohydrolase [Dehalogenimonas sp. 4OHTPN]|uniref:HD domain-containing phosphohydrolase n=1 Tax=Dehalogenimonas sp. 4OHTPN TaxID=3166643 RepID=A0AAU8GBL3_9CHLR